MGLVKDHQPVRAGGLANVSDQIDAGQRLGHDPVGQLGRQMGLQPRDIGIQPRPVDDQRGVHQPGLFQGVLHICKVGIVTTLAAVPRFAGRRERDGCCQAPGNQGPTTPVDGGVSHGRARS